MVSDEDQTDPRLAKEPPNSAQSGDDAPPPIPGDEEAAAVPREEEIPPIPLEEEAVPGDEAVTERVPRRRDRLVHAVVTGPVQPVGPAAPAARRRPRVTGPVQLLGPVTTGPVEPVNEAPDADAPMFLDEEEHEPPPFEDDDAPTRDVPRRSRALGVTGPQLPQPGAARGPRMTGPVLPARRPRPTGPQLPVRRRRPSVAELFEDLEAKDEEQEQASSAAGERPIDTQIAVTSHLERLTQARERLSAHCGGSGVVFTQALADAKAVLAAEGDFIEEVQQDTAVDAMRREELLDAFFRLKRLVDKEDAPAAAADTDAAKPADAPSAKSARRQARRRPHRARGALRPMLVLLGLLLAGRAALLVYDHLARGAHEGAVHHVKRKGQVAAVTFVPPSTRQTTQGIPKVVSARVIVTPRGLVSSAQALDPNGDKVTYTFTWLEDGRPLEHDGDLLPRELLHAGRSYQLAVVASDGKHLSPRFTTEPLTFRPETKGAK